MSAPGIIARLAAGLLALPLAAAEPIVIDGSSTVYPIAVAVGEAYSARSAVPLQIAVSGTTGGMRLFATGKAPVVGASRPIRPDEVTICAQHGIDFVELPVALDGLTVAVGAQNAFIDHLTVAELKRLWQPGSDVRTWAQLRKGWPDTPVALFGPGQDSGTFDFFTEVVVGEARAIREDFTGRKDPNDQVQGLVVNPNALGYFGWSYFQQNRGMLRAVAIDGGDGPLQPSRDLIASGKYMPLSRPLFFYVNVAALERSEIRDFLALALSSPELIEGAGYVPLAEPLYAAARKRLLERRTGTVFAGVAPSAALATFIGPAVASSAVAKPVATTTPAPTSTPAGGANVRPAPATDPARRPTSASAPTAVAPRVAITAAPAKPSATPAVVAVTTPSVSAVPPTPSTSVAAVMPMPTSSPVATVVPTPPAAAATATADATAKVEATPAQLERLRAASFALTRATLERDPDPADLERRATALKAAIAALPGRAATP